MVVAKLSFTPESNHGELLRMQGRPSGFVGWLLTSLGLTDETVFRADEGGVTLAGSSLHGKSTSFVPYRAVSSVRAGYQQPVFVVVFGALLGLAALVSVVDDLRSNTLTMTTGLLIAGAFACWFWYQTQRNLYIVVETHGGNLVGVSFKPSVIEGVGLDIQRACQIMAAMEAKVRQSPTPVT